MSLEDARIRAFGISIDMEPSVYFGSGFCPWGYAPTALHGLSSLRSLRAGTESKNLIGRNVTTLERESNIGGV